MFKNLTTLINAIGKDKWIYYTACLLIFQFQFSIGHACRLGNWFAGVAFAVTILIAFIKEKIDQKKTGAFNHNDFVAGFLGAFTGIVLASIMLI